MLSRITNAVAVCLGAPGSLLHQHQDALLTSTDAGRHAYGDFSMAAVQANLLIEDQSELQSCPFGTFVGIYDGHGGPEAARFIKEHLLSHLIRFTSERRGMSTDALRLAFSATEEGFESLVAEAWPITPQLAAVGSCCLVGVVCGRTLYIANLGDSRAVLGSFCKASAVVKPVQLSSEDNVAIEAVRNELRSLHPDDSRIVMLKHGVWRVKGIIQVSKSIGDVYLKKQEFNREPLFSRFRLSEPLLRPVISAEPIILVREIQPDDKFLIFASDGLWEHLSNDEAVAIVHNHPHRGIARRLIKAALQEAAKKREVRYADLKKIERGVRRHFHDDITVIVVFLDQELIGKVSTVNAVEGGVRLVDKDSISCKAVNGFLV